MTPTAPCELLLPDPLKQAVGLPLEARFSPLGFPLVISTNSERVVAAAAESWAQYPEVFAAPPIRLHVAVNMDGPTELPPPPVCRGRGHLFVMISDASNFAVSDHTSQFAFCWLTPGAVADIGFTRFHFLEGLVYSMLAQSRLTMVHAACVSRGGRGVLLGGESGDGKSSIAFACASAGWTYISDDASSLVRGNHTRMVLGRPFHIRFRPSARELFPELRLRMPELGRNGKLTIEVPTADLPGIETALQARVDFVVFLNRHSRGKEGLVPIAKADALNRLLKDLPVFDPAMREQQEAPCRLLMEAGTFELRYRDLGAAVHRLERLVEAGS